jgi:hypothetical protein
MTAFDEVCDGHRPPLQLRRLRRGIFLWRQPCRLRTNRILQATRPPTGRTRPVASPPLQLGCGLRYVFLLPERMNDETDDGNADARVRHVKGRPRMRKGNVQIE